MYSAIGRTEFVPVLSTITGDKFHGKNVRGLCVIYFVLIKSLYGLFAALETCCVSRGLLLRLQK